LESGIEGVVHNSLQALLKTETRWGWL